MHPVNLRFLRTFVTIADSSGFARAAARLNLTQSAASRQIHALESELGVRLFDRIGRRIKLTSEGEDLLVRSRRLLSDAESLGERARALKSGQTGVLRVGAAPQIMENLLADFLQLYRKRHPGIEIHLVEDQGARLPARLEAGDMHVAILPDSDDRFFHQPLYPMLMVAVVPKNHRFARRRCSTWRTWQRNRCCDSVPGSRRTLGSTWHAGLNRFDPACCLKALHLIR